MRHSRESILNNVNTGLGPENTFYKPNHSCLKPKFYTNLYKENFLSEFLTEEDKERVRKNLGLEVYPRIRGAYDNETFYNKLDIVSYAGASYMALKKVFGIPPLFGVSTDEWFCLARPVQFDEFTEDLIELIRGYTGDKGDKGDKGDRGPTGFNGSIDNFVVLSSAEYESLPYTDPNKFYFTWESEEIITPAISFENLILNISGNIVNNVLNVNGTLTNNILNL